MVRKVKSEDVADYKVTGDSDDSVIDRALSILAVRIKRDTNCFSSPGDVRNYCRLTFGALQYEVFSVLFLDSQNRLIELQEMFRGTLTQCSVYPREILRAALACNAAAVIFCHNHPSGSVQPSRADEQLTQTLKQALAMVDVRVLDHIIVSNTGISSFAETGLI